MNRVRRMTVLPWLACCMLVVAGCGGSSSGSASESKDEPPSAPVESVLMIDGKHAGSAVPESPADEDADEDTDSERRDRTDHDGDVIEYEALPLLADGTIDDGPDPFDGSYVQVQAMPIEDDPNATGTIAEQAETLRRIDREVWDRWMDGDARSPWQQGDNPTAASLVEVTVERCGGARQVATGVVLDDETVVTNVHVVENAAKRVRVAPAIGDPPRIPAMIRYLDVDDDVAVLRVPGLRSQPLAFHRPTGVEPQWGYAFGVAPGGRSGTLRRTPVITSVQEESVTLEQPDGFAEEISDRPVQTVVGGVTTGFSGGVVVATNDTSLATNWGFHGLLRARMGLRADTAAVAVPSRIVQDALTAAEQLEEWYEIRPGGCPQWHR